VAELLAPEWTVYAYDRRGHGASGKPTPVSPGSGLGYDFPDFVDDLSGVMDALSLRDAYGVGHSAGATDVLLAAGQRPELFTRAFAFEPTVAHPCVDDPEQPAGRDAEFPSREAAFARYGSRPPLDVWRASALWDYVEAGFEVQPGGSVRLACTPELEAEMLVAIGSAIQRNRVAAGLADPFAALERIACPVMLTAGELSPPMYARMTTGACRAIPEAELQEIPGCTHYFPMQLPEEFAARVRAFAALHS
jgi:pimeloyl-ACP methyl ester carboxylesterase